jgi:hypothetical protein
VAFLKKKSLKRRRKRIRPSALWNHCLKSITHSKKKRKKKGKGKEKNRKEIINQAYSSFCIPEVMSGPSTCMEMSRDSPLRSAVHHIKTVFPSKCASRHIYSPGTPDLALLSHSSTAHLVPPPTQNFSACSPRYVSKAITRSSGVSFLVGRNLNPDDILLRFRRRISTR